MPRDWSKYWQKCTISHGEHEPEIDTVFDMEKFTDDYGPDAAKIFSAFSQKYREGGFSLDAKIKLLVARTELRIKWKVDADALMDGKLNPTGEGFNI